MEKEAFSDGVCPSVEATTLTGKQGTVLGDSEHSRGSSVYSHPHPHTFIYSSPNNLRLHRHEGINKTHV